MTRQPFEYAVLRVVPRVERGESINAGVVLYSPEHGYLGGRVHLDVERLRALDPNADVAGIRAVLDGLAEGCAGLSVRRDGPAKGANDAGRHFRWLTAPRSTVVQPGPVHTGLTTDPAAELDRLLHLLVH